MLPVLSGTPQTEGWGTHILVEVQTLNEVDEVVELLFLKLVLLLWFNPIRY